MSDTGCVQIFVSLVAVITLLLKAAVKKKKKNPKNHLVLHSRTAAGHKYGRF